MYFFLCNIFALFCPLLRSGDALFHEWWAKQNSQQKIKSPHPIILTEELFNSQFVCTWKLSAIRSNVKFLPETDTRKTVPLSFVYVFTFWFFLFSCSLLLVFSFFFKAKLTAMIAVLKLGSVVSRTHTKSFALHRWCSLKFMRLDQWEPETKAKLSLNTNSIFVLQLKYLMPSVIETSLCQFGHWRGNLKPMLAQLRTYYLFHQLMQNWLKINAEESSQARILDLGPGFLTPDPDLTPDRPQLHFLSKCLMHSLLQVPHYFFLFSNEMTPSLLYSAGFFIWASRASVTVSAYSQI